MDLSKLSDEELMKIAGVSKKPESFDMSKLSDEELMKIAGSQPKAEAPSAWRGVAEDTLAGVEEVGKTYDAYSGGASTRAAIGALQDGGGLSGAVRRAKEVYGEKDLPEGLRAPTGKEIAEKAGYSKDRSLFTLPVIGEVSPAGLVGLGIDVAADPINVIGGSVVKGAGKVAGAVGEAIGKGAEIAARPLKPIAEARAVKGVLSSGKSMFEYALDPKIADDWGMLAESAAKNGIDPEVLPESFKYGRKSLINTLARRNREIDDAAGEGFLNAYRDVQGALQEKVAKVGGGATPTAVDGGEALKAGYDKAWSKLFEDNQLTYNKLIAQNPDVSIKGPALNELKSHLKELEGFASEQMAEGLTDTAKSQGKALKQAVDRMVSKGEAAEGAEKTLESIEEIPLNKVVSAFRDIQKQAFPKNKNAITLDPQDVEKFRDLYHAIIRSVGDAVEQQLPQGAEVASALKQSNKNISDFLKEREIVEKVLGNSSLGSESVFKSLVMNGDTRKIEALKKVVSPDEMQTVKAAVFQELIDGAKNTDGWVGFAKIRNQLRDKRHAFKDLFTPEEAEEFAEVVRLGDRFGEFPLSTSGTGPSLELSGKGVGKAVLDASTDRLALERLKSRADTRDLRLREGSVGRLGPGESTSNILNTIRQLKQPIGNTDLTPGDILLRAAQSGSIQETNRKKGK